MALRTTIKKNVYGEDKSYECYAKITYISGDKQSINMNVEHKLFSNQSITMGVLGYKFKPSTEDSSENFIKQGYQYLKTLVEYTDAIDC